MHTIGIDFGTTKTLVSHIHPQTGHPAPLRLGRGSDYLPTSIYVDTAGRLFFGDDAEDMIEEPSGCYLRGFKMQLGSATPLHIYLDAGKPSILTAKEMVKEYLQYIREQVQQLVYHGEPVTMATITRPVKFSPAQCEELKQAAHDAGFNTVELTTEPEAAGLAFCRMNAAQAFKRSALIVDWGGGTLDFALVTREGDTICTHSNLTDGDTTMGGEKFDELLWRHCEQVTHCPLSAVTQLPKVRRAKEQLSTQESTVLRLSSTTGACPPHHLSRADFNKLIEADIDAAVTKLQRLITKTPSEYKPEMLLLVGGSSKIPLIKEKLEAACHLPAHSWHYSQEAVAMGAALWKTNVEKLAKFQVQQGDNYYNGRNGYPQDANKALEHYHRAAELDYHWGYFNVGKCYLEGKGVKKDDSEARNWFRKAEATADNPWATRWLALLGDAHAARRISEYYATGSKASWEMHPNEAEAERFRQLADEIPRDLVEWGDNYYHARNGCEHNPSKALECYRQAAEYGNHWGYFNVGKCYLEGQGVPKDDNKAREWFLKAKAANPENVWTLLKLAELGDAPSMCEVADRYYYGNAADQGLYRDTSEALKWYRASAAGGYHWGYHNVGKCYLEGQGIKKNDDEARIWFRKAYEVGENLWSLYWLAAMGDANAGRKIIEYCDSGRAYQLLSNEDASALCAQVNKFR
ncbi:MAG: Hsp70 family protein [Akkermansia sp.]|nr:Hsp70 family protein [Akkermansia sp.]